MTGDSGSDHEYITFELTERRQVVLIKNCHLLGWNLAQIDERRLTEFLQNWMGNFIHIAEHQPRRADAEEIVEKHDAPHSLCVPQECTLGKAPSVLVD